MNNQSNGPQKIIFEIPQQITSSYKIISELGRGAFSTVYKVKSNIDQQYYCLKKINLKKTPDKNNEINLLQKLSHPNLVKYISSYTDSTGIYIVMEYCEYGDLYSLLHSVKKRKSFVSEDIIWDIAFQCLLGLEYLHSKNIIHRDMKLLNLFMSKNKLLKIGDLGMSKLIENKDMKMSRVGTPLYLAPELVKKEKYNFKADIWSLGCSLYHLAATIPPFNDENLIRLGYLIINCQPDKLPDCYSEKLNSFILMLMKKDKNLRPSATDCIKMIPEKTKNKYNSRFSKELNQPIEIPKEKSCTHTSLSSSSAIKFQRKSKGSSIGLGVSGRLLNKYFRDLPKKKRKEQLSRKNKNIIIGHILSHDSNLQTNMSKTTFGMTNEGFFKPNKSDMYFHQEKKNTLQKENEAQSNEQNRFENEYNKNLFDVNKKMLKLNQINHSIFNPEDIERKEKTKTIEKQRETQVYFPKIFPDKKVQKIPEFDVFEDKKEEKKVNFRKTFQCPFRPHKVLTIFDLK